MRCPICKSIWVCWNWCGGNSEWLHECWNCSHCFITKGKKYFGVPYFLLKNFAESFVEAGLYEKNLKSAFEMLASDSERELK